MKIEIKFINRRLQARRRKLWVKALRSGDYDQTQHYLHDNSGYCCLGVACDVYRRATGKGEWLETPPFDHDDNPPFIFDPGNNGSNYADSSVLPWPVQEWFGLTENRGAIKSDERKHTLSEANDDAGLSFHEIADIIENGEVEVQ